MNLQNGYKVIYEKAADGKRTFYASKTGFFADAEVITEANIGEYKLIYEKDGRFYGSTTGIPAEDDFCFEAFDKVFKEGATSEATTVVEEVPTEEPVVEEDEVAEEVVEEVEEDEVVVEEDEIEDDEIIEED